MVDFYGNEYVESRWTRFVAFWQLFGFNDKRNAAFLTWANNLLRQLEGTYRVISAPKVIKNWSGDQTWVEIQLPAVAGTEYVALGLGEYDVLTKQALDPGAYVVAALQWLSTHPRPVEE